MANQIELIKVSELEPYAKNSRTHSESQIKGVMRSIEEFGFNNPVLIKGKTILAGHCRIEAAKRLGMTEIPCIPLEHLSPQQARAYVIADNKHALNAGWDDKILTEELQSLLDEDFDLEVIGFDENFFNSLKMVDDFVPDLPPDDDEKSDSNSFQVTIQCKDEDEQQMIFLELRDRGLAVKAK